MPKKTAKKTSAKSTRSKAPATFGSKTKFILSFPGDTPAREIVEKAQATGVQFSEKYVYVVRSNAKVAAQKRAARSGQVAARALSAAADGALESQLRKVIAELGLARARQIFSDVEAAFEGQ